MGNAWYIAVDGATSGPHSRETMERLLAQGRISADTPVWCEGMADWIACADSGLGSSPEDATAAESTPLARWFETMPTSFGLDGHEPDVWTPRLAVEDDGWQSTRATPWRRYFARMFDTVILGATIWFVLGFVLAASSTRLYEALVGPHGLARSALLSTMVTFFLIAPLEAVMIGLSGTTVGKWVFGVRITRPNGHAIGVLHAARREAAVLVRGVALGIPLFSLVTMIVGYQTLAGTGSASWDHGDWVVTCRESGAVQTCLSIAGVVAWLVALVIIQALAAQAKG
jgi:uncharacterized RDD family membrane protein YckC